MAGCTQGILFWCHLPVLPGCPWVVKPWVHEESLFNIPCMIFIVRKEKKLYK